MVCQDASKKHFKTRCLLGPHASSANLQHIGLDTYPRAHRDAEPVPLCATRLRLDLLPFLPPQVGIQDMYIEMKLTPYLGGCVGT
jgi:hypothetical protein